MIKINTENIKKDACYLHAGDELLLTGTIFTARDAAHKRFAALLDSGEQLPFDLRGSVIYYAGPTPSRGNMPIGSCGPTTSSRMDIYSPRLLDMGLAATIGKGPRSKDVIDAIVRNCAVYLCAIGGAGALAAKSVVSLEIIAFDDLGCESVKKLAVRDFPLICGIDTRGISLF